MDAGGKLDVAVGVPVASQLQGDGRVNAGSIPAGRYAVLKHIGPYTGLHAATRGLVDWGVENGVVWKTADDGTWGAHIESYLTDPKKEPNSEKWQTEIAFQVADS
jgi:effector-binding domain-containing protein